MDAEILPIEKAVSIPQADLLSPVADCNQYAAQLAVLERGGSFAAVCANLN